MMLNYLIYSKILLVEIWPLFKLLLSDKIRERVGFCAILSEGKLDPKEKQKIILQIVNRVNEKASENKRAVVNII